MKNDYIIKNEHSIFEKSLCIFRITMLSYRKTREKAVFSCMTLPMASYK